LAVWSRHLPIRGVVATVFTTSCGQDQPFYKVNGRIMSIFFVTGAGRAQKKPCAAQCLADFSAPGQQMGCSEQPDQVEPIPIYRLEPAYKT
jgi:hypothetical protein